MKTKATSKIVTPTKVTTTTAKVKNNIFGRAVIKTKKTTDSYAPIAAGGTVYQGSNTVKTKKVYKNGVLMKSKIR